MGFDHVFKGLMLVLIGMLLVRGLDAVTGQRIRRSRVEAIRDCALLLGGAGTDAKRIAALESTACQDPLSIEMVVNLSEEDTPAQ